MTNVNQWLIPDYLKLTLWFIPAAIVTWSIHEVAHWTTGTLLGYDMWLTFNRAGPVQGGYDSILHQIMISLSGPVVTLLQGGVAYLFIKKQGLRQLYPFLFLALYMRLIAVGISYISKPNDEAAVSLLLGLPMWLVPSLFVSILLLLTYLGSKSLRVGWKGNVLSYVMSSIMVTLIVVLDGIVFD